jgi:hypothetical protein
MYQGKAQFHLPVGIRMRAHQGRHYKLGERFDNHPAQPSASSAYFTGAKLAGHHQKVRAGLG